MEGKRNNKRKWIYLILGLIAIFFLSNLSIFGFSISSFLYILSFYVAMIFGSLLVLLENQVGSKWSLVIVGICLVIVSFFIIQNLYKIITYKLRKK